MVSSAVALPIPEDLTNSDKSDFFVGDYWRVIFGIPIALGLIQIALLITVFNYETPKYLK